MSDGSSPVVIDLFCGAGGLSEGLAQAGFRPVVGVDFDAHAAATIGTTIQVCRWCKTTSRR